MSRQSEARAEYVGGGPRVVGLGRHYSVELRGVTDKNEDGADRQDILRACAVGEELLLESSTNHRPSAETLKISRKSGQQLGYVAPITDLARKLSEGRKFRVKLQKVYPHRGQAGKQGAVLDFEEVNEVPIVEEKPGLETKWIVIIGIGVLLVAAGAAKLFGLF